MALSTSSVPSSHHARTANGSAAVHGTTPRDVEAVSPLKRRKTRRDDMSLGSALRRMLFNHQLGLSINFILLLGLTYALFPSLRTTARAVLLLSYPSPASPGVYGQGPKDIYFVAGWVVCFSGIRAFLLDYVLTPLAGVCGISKKKAKTRFAEQAYLLLYYVVYWSWGVTLFVQDTPHDVRSAESLLLSLWKDYPRVLLPPQVKLYYLMQMAFWVQQIVVIHLEAPRKDHYQMLTHHFVTVGLMVTSYGCRQLRVGTAILVCMDAVDLIFPLAKILRYMALQTACDIAFGVFVLVWIFARHACYLAICWSIYAHVGVVGALFGAYSVTSGERVSPDGGTRVLENLLQPFVRPASPTFCFNANTKAVFLALLMALQAITLLWLVMIIRVVIRVLRGEGADDSRSDDEDECECDDEDEDEDGELESDDLDGKSAAVAAGLDAAAEKPQFIEVEASSEDVTWPIRKGSGSWMKSKGISSGLNFGDHKEILNRIGCLSEEQLAREREKREDTGSPRPRSAGRR